MAGGVLCFKSPNHLENQKSVRVITPQDKENSASSISQVQKTRNNYSKNFIELPQKANRVGIC